MKIYMPEFNQYLGGLTDDDPDVRQRAVRSLAKYSGAQWQGSPDAVSAAVPALVKAVRLQGAAPSDVAFRAEATKSLGNIGTESPAIVTELRVRRTLAAHTVHMVRTSRRKPAIDPLFPGSTQATPHIRRHSCGYSYRCSTAIIV